MRKYLHINLKHKKIDEKELQGEEIVRAGRYLIAKTLCEHEVATADPLSADNPLIISAGPFAGTNFSNANRTSIGCKSPLTGGIKESNAGGTFAVALGQLHIAGLNLYDVSDDWTVIHISKDGNINFESAEAYLGKGNFEAAALLHEKYGKKVSIALCGPVGEYQGLLAGIAISDTDLRPARLAARGGVGAVMGSKKVKAIVVDLHKMPTLHERKKVIGAIRQYAEKLGEDNVIDSYNKLGTAMMADYMNHIGGLPVNNFSAGRLVDTDEERMKMGGDFIREQNLVRGGDTSHACMPGCLIKCSNVYADAEGKEIVSPVEYETIGLMGTNCGLSDPDELAQVNYIANDLGIDTIETGATIGVLMEAGVGKFGDVNFIVKVLQAIADGTDEGKLWSQGTARVGAHYDIDRVPVIKKQAISAYDPRVVEVTGVTMMVTAQGADHTAGNVPRFDCSDKSIAEIVAASLDAQIATAATDSLGFCIFGRTVTLAELTMITNAINDAHGTRLEPGFFDELGRMTLKLEADFNMAAGFTTDDDELPEFFYKEALQPTGKQARFHSTEINESLNKQINC
ncbi:MAG: aldehyde ferredoxin oxidoreductase [Gammaproteobacteria bacterium]|jgi:aldehyde:ferredoxin oxidoreductase|nr:aldehyde ferredoxin oxidoreductase [Gammaproteobacteria bacterium]